MKASVNKAGFLWDVFLCALASYGGPEAHYGVYSQIMVEKRGYLTEEELSELIGLYSLVPGPGSSQVITAIGYYVGGPLVAWLTFLIWALPAIVVLSLIGVFFSLFSHHELLLASTAYLPHVAVAFIIYAALRMSRQVLKDRANLIHYILALIASLLLIGRSIWSVPLILLLSGLLVMFRHAKGHDLRGIYLKFNWTVLGLLVGVALVNEVVVRTWDMPLLHLFNSFYRYGYSAMGGGQVVIPLMISDLVQAQSLISLDDFLAGYAIDQAIPGPLFSFAAFVSARTMAATPYAFLAGLVGGLAIFLPGILLVFVIFPLWRSMKDQQILRYFLRGVTVAVAALVTSTAISSTMALDVSWQGILVLILSSLALVWNKVPAPLIVVLAGLAGLILS